MKEKIKAPPKLDALTDIDADYDYNDPYFLNLMDLFDDGGKVRVYSGEPCPIESSSSGITMDELVKEVMLIGHAKLDANEDLLKHLPKARKAALEKELSNGDEPSQ